MSDPARAVYRFSPRGVVHAVVLIGHVGPRDLRNEVKVWNSAATACGRDLSPDAVAAMSDGEPTCKSCATVAWRTRESADEIRRRTAA